MRPKAVPADEESSAWATDSKFVSVVIETSLNRLAAVVSQRIQLE
jgi:hypothetical protein